MDSELKPLQIPQSLLSKTITKNKQTILAKNQFQNIGGNSFIEIDPPIVKFTGYELDKINSITIKIVNKAPIPQRIHVLPNPSQNFNVKLDKKGILASGMSQNLQIQFKSNQYKYYYQTLKINTQTDNFLIPIHAYPAMNQSALRELFPKVIDFGTIFVFQTESNKYPIINKIPLNFEFEFVILKPCQQFTIEPLKGLIPGKGMTEIQIKFTPKEKITYSMEVQLRISQFDFENLKIKLVGNGKGKQEKKRPSSKIRTINNPSNKEFNNSNLKLMNNTHNKLRNSIKDLNNTNPNRQFTPLNISNTLMTSSKRIQKNQYKLQNQKQYIDRYNEVMGLDKEKQIKFSIYNGDSPMTQEKINQFIEKKRIQKNEMLKKLEIQTSQRNVIQVNRSLPVIQYAVLNKKQPNFNTEKNDELKKRKNLLKKLMKAGSQILIQIRMTKRLKKMKEFLKGCANKEQVQKKIDLDVQTASQILNSGQDYVKFTFDQSNLFEISTYKLQFSQNTTIGSVKPYKIEPKDEFDDKKQFLLINQDQVQIMNYTNMAYPLGFINLNKITPQLRESCQQQKPFRGTTIPNINQPLSKLSKVYQLPLDLPAHFFIVESSIKKYKKDTYFDQKTIQYLFEDKQPVEDEFIGWNNPSHEVDILKAKFMRNPGFEFNSFHGFVNSELQTDVGFIKNHHKYAPKIIQKALQDDPFSQNDSDNDQYPTIHVPKLEEVIKKVQNDHKGLAQRRQHGQVINQNNKLLNRMIKILETYKQKNLLAAITKQVEYNKFSNKNKIIIV